MYVQLSEDSKGRSRTEMEVLWLIKGEDSTVKAPHDPSMRFYKLPDNAQLVFFGSVCCLVVIALLSCLIFRIMAMEEVFRSHQEGMSCHDHVQVSTTLEKLAVAIHDSA